MKQSIRAFGWATTISTIILFVFLASAVYSMSETLVTNRGLAIGNFEVNVSDNTLFLSIPVTINNTGYYDMIDFNATATIRDTKGEKIMSDSLFMDEIKTGTRRTESLNLSLDIGSLSDMSDLMFYDSELRIDISIGLGYARALSFQLTTENSTMKWGAPLYGLSLGESVRTQYNGTHLNLYVPLEVENHSYLEISGDILARANNQNGGFVGEGREEFVLSSGSRYNDRLRIPIPIEHPSNYTGRGTIEIYLDVPALNTTFRIGEVTYG